VQPEKGSITSSWKVCGANHISAEKASG